MTSRIRRRLAHVLDRRFFALHDRVEHLATRVEDLARAAEERDAETRRLIAELGPTLRIMAGNDAQNRRLLAAARADPGYGLAYTEGDPLVTVIVPTHDRAELLGTRALPSILAQTHERLQVLVIGDGASDETEEAVRGAGDDRVSYLNLTQRYVYPDGSRRRLAQSTLARNEGYRLGEGRWMFEVDDDDAVPRDAIANLLAAAREQRLESVQGRIRQHEPDGGTTEIVPLTLNLSLTGGVVHAHLRFFEREHVAAALGVGGDVFRGERMIRAGVRVGTIDQVTYEYYPATLWER